MRPFEILLIAANLLALLLSFRKQSMLVWSSVVALNLAILLVHLGVEGSRYQMACSYAFVLILVTHVVGRASGIFSKLRAPKALKVITKSFVVLLLMLTAFVAYALPVFSLPKPTGAYPVGSVYFDLVDQSRTDPFLAGTTQKRELMIKVYYPAKQDDAKSYSRYFHGSTKLTRALAAFYQMPYFMFDHLTLVTTYTKDDLAPLDEQPRYPVVLFAHGAGASMEVETSQSEDLASHGYIVAAVDYPYVSAATVFPNRVVLAREATTDFSTPEPAEPITQIMADDSEFVIDKLSEMNKGELASPFKGKLDLDRLGVIGHSVGGAVAYNMAINDKRIKAAINLDGTVYVTPRSSNAIAPFLMLANDKYHVQAIENQQNLMEKFDTTPEGQQALRDIYGNTKSYEAAYAKAQQNIIGLAAVLKASGNLYTIEGSDHMKFTDIGLFIGSRWLRELLQIRGKTAPVRCLEITQSLTVAFLDQYLKGQIPQAIPALLKTYPELKQIHLN